MYAVVNLAWMECCVTFGHLLAILLYILIVGDANKASDQHLWSEEDEDEDK